MNTKRVQELGTVAYCQAGCQGAAGATATQLAGAITAAAAQSTSATDPLAGA